VPPRGYVLVYVGSILSRGNPPGACCVAIIAPLPGKMDERDRSPTSFIGVLANARNKLRHDIRVMLYL
jgi:hypothetical protein